MNRVTLIVAATTNNGIGQAGKLPWRLPQEMQYFARVTTGEGGTPGGEGKKNAVVMGRATWESIPRRFRPLQGRINFVVSQQAEYDLCVGRFLLLHEAISAGLTGALSLRTCRGVTGTGTGDQKNKNKGQDDEGASDTEAAVLASSLDTALGGAHDADANRVFVIGGARLYAAALPLAERVLLTRIIEPSFEECDVFMPDFIGSGEWLHAPHDALCAWVGFEVPGGVQEERGVKYGYEMWTRTDGEGPK